MRKLVLLSFVLCLGLMVYSQPVSAVTIHNALYDWFLSGGTRVTPLSPTGPQYYVGTVTGSAVLEVEEVVYDLGNGLAQYTWNLVHDVPPPGTTGLGVDVFSFHVPSLGATPYYYTENAPPGGSAWTFSAEGGWYVWQAPNTDTNGLGPGEDITFTVYTNTLAWAISAGAVDAGPVVNNERQIYNGGGYWVVSHPTPEPST